jgi:3-hydroxyacyl-[acyl-carrier-protein] dehydratase
MSESILDIKEILEILPHRYPFLLVDKIIEFEASKSALGIKNVTVNEPFFQGHFPGNPIMPGVLIIEAMAQIGGILAFKSADVSNKGVYFMGIDKAKFRRPVVPGDTLSIKLEVTKTRGKIWKFHAKAHVEDKLAAEADLMATIVDL